MKRYSTIVAIVILYTTLLVASSLTYSTYGVIKAKDKNIVSENDMIFEDVNCDSENFLSFVSSFDTWYENIDLLNIDSYHYIISDGDTINIVDSHEQVDKNKDVCHTTLLKPNYTLDMWEASDDRYVAISTESESINWVSLSDNSINNDVKEFCYNQSIEDMTCNVISTLIHYVSENDFIVNGKHVTYTGAGNIMNIITPICNNTDCQDYKIDIIYDDDIIFITVIYYIKDEHVQNDVYMYVINKDLDMLLNMDSISFSNESSGKELENIVKEIKGRR